MPVRSSLRLGGRLAAVVVLVCLCAGGSLARTAPSMPMAQPKPTDAPIALPPGPLHLAALEPADLAAPTPAPAAPKGPFGLAAVKTGRIFARWHMLEPVIRLERLILAQCRAHSAPCPAAAARFNSIIAAARTRNGRARIGEVNRAVNLAIRAVSDRIQFGAPDVWASPLMTFGSGAGDCEDYAIAKYVALGEAGVPAADLRLVLVHDNAVNQGHMVAAARLNGRWLILDNRTMRLVADSEVRNLTPLASLGGAADAPALATAPLPAEPPVQARETVGLPVLL